MDISKRREILKKLSQVNTSNLPSDGALKNKVVTSLPPTFQFSAMYPGIRTGFNSASITIIDNLISLLNTSLHYASGGLINFQVLKNNNFNFDASSAPSVDQKNLMLLSKRVFTRLLNSGNVFAQKATKDEIENATKQILSSPEFNNLSHINPTGQLASKVNGNIKTLITNYLTYLKLANP